MSRRMRREHFTIGCTEEPPYVPPEYRGELLLGSLRFLGNSPLYSGGT
jgi:hypothetical protein